MASNRIKGITIELDGNTTKLQKALAGVDKQLSATKSSLKDVEKLLKLDPGNSELLTQKQKYLGEAIDGTKEKLRQEKEALEQLKNAPATEETIKQQEALEREILETEKALEGLTQEYKNFGSVSAQQIANVGNKMQEIGGKMQAAGSTLTKNVTAPIVGIAAASAAAWKEVDEAMDTVVTKTGASGEQLEEMKDIVSNIATDIPADFQEIGDAVGEVNTRFGLTGPALEELSSQFIKFARVNNTDVSSSIDSVQSAMAAFDVSAEDAGKFLDMINKAGQDTGVSVDKLADDMKTNAEALKEMGLNASDAAMFLANLDKNGVDTSTAITGLKTALKNATKDGKTSKQAFDELQDTMATASSKTEAMQKAMELFGNKAGAALGAAIYEGKLQLDSFGTSLDQFQGNLSDTFEQTLDPADQLKTSLNALKETGAELFSTIQEVGAPLLKQLSETLKELNEKFKALSPEQKELIVKVGAAAAAAGPLLLVLGKITSAIGSVLTLAPQITGAISSLTGAFTGASGAAGGLSGALTVLTGPVGVVIAAVAALTAAIVTLWNTNDEFRATITQGVEEIKAAFTDASQTILQALDECGIHFKDFGELAKAVWTTLCDNIAPDIERAFNNAKDIIVFTLEYISHIFAFWMNVIKGDWSGAWEELKKVVESVVKLITNLVSNFVNWIGGKFEWIGGIVGKIKDAANSVKNVETNVQSSHGGGGRRFASAMNHGVILSKPTIFGAQNGKYLQAGEAGDEVVVGANSLSSMIRASVPQTDMSQLSNVISDAVGMALQQYGITLEVEANQDGIFNSVVQSNSVYKKMHGGVGALA